MTQSTPDVAQHSKIEDGLAVIIGTFIISFAVLMMKQGSVVTGGTAGLALLTHYATGINVGLMFFLINIPFYYLAFKRLGMQMVVKTFIAVTLFFLMVDNLHPYLIDVNAINPLYASILANVLIGLGMLILFRHRSSLGGFNLLALYIQEYYNIPAGRVQTVMDAAVIFGSMAFVSVKIALISVLGVVILNAILTLNHRPDRYVGK